MVSRKNRKILMAAAVCSMLILSGCAAAPMGEHSELSFKIFGSHSGYYSNFTAETEDGGYRIQGTANLGSDLESSVVRMSAEEEQTAMVEGALDGKKGSLSLVYTAADGTETVIAECDDASYEAFDVNLMVTEEESVLRLSGSGDYEVCDFEIFIVGDGIHFNLGGKGGKENAPEAPDTPDASETAGVPEVPDVPEAPDVPDAPDIPEAPDVPKAPDAPDVPEAADIAEMFDESELPGLSELDGPIVDNWPESISCVADGLTAKPFHFELPVDAPTTLSLACVIEEGRLRIQIKDSEGKILFDEKKIDTEDFKIPADISDTYTVSVWAEQYYGKFEIRPDKVSESLK